MTDSNKTLSYKDAGVDIDAGNALVERIKSVSKATHRPEVKGNLGGFGALCSIPQKYKNPLLVSGTDGVGTKLRLAMDNNQHGGIGIDLVAMCVNDLIVQGAEPLFFLDYYATGKLDVDTATSVVTGIGKGCEYANCALIGGETAEMPGMYHGNDYDVAGFCVGVVEADKVINPINVKVGDTLIALASSGPHSNGYSLIRKIIEVAKIDVHQNLNDKSILQHLLEPTRIYVKSILALLEKYEVNAISHITGGGFWENIPRVLPNNVTALIDESSWQWPEIFSFLQEKGNVTTHEMYRTFNCGVGLLLAVNPDEAKDIVTFLNEQSEQAWVIGKVVEQTGAASTSTEPSVVIK